MSICNTIFDCSIMDLPRIKNRSGNITPLNDGIEIPFAIQRVYYLYDIPTGASRGGHAHYELHQYLIAASGSFDVKIEDGYNKRTVFLNRPYHALHIVPGIWRELTNFSSGSVCMVMASHLYAAEDYIRDYDIFKEYKQYLFKSNNI